MQDYLLFIDTETSGLPKNWNLPYIDNDNWPYAVQVSWVIYDSSFKEIKREDHYIRDNDFKIKPKAFKIHGIDRHFLNVNGEPRKSVLDKLSADLLKYQPLIIGHFVELDYHVTGADYYRSKMENPMITLPRFCTMLATTGMIQNPQVQHLRLGQLYYLLFNEHLPVIHNAVVDAEATARCFFELIKTGQINDQKINQQQVDRNKLSKPVLNQGCGLTLLLIFILTVLIIYWI